MTAPAGHEDELPLGPADDVPADELPPPVEGVGELVADPLSGAVVPATGDAPAGTPRDDPGPPPEDEVPLSPS